MERFAFHHVARLQHNVWEKIRSKLEYRMRWFGVVKVHRMFTRADRPLLPVTVPQTVETVQYSKIDKKKQSVKHRFFQPLCVHAVNGLQPAHICVAHQFTRTNHLIPVFIFPFFEMTSSPAAQH